MSTSQSDLLQTLENDRSNLESILEQFRRNGILTYFERMLDLISSLSVEVQGHVSSSAGHFVRSSGTIAIPWDLKLRMHMIHSAWNQFTFAISHLLRAQASESYGHVRRAIEGAGVAYLSKSEPDVAELYGTGDEKKLRNRTGTNTILPPGDPLTSDLNRMVREASSQVHNNFRSLTKRLEEEILDEGKRARYRFKAHFYEADDSLKHFWQVSYFILGAGYLVMRLLADSSDLPRGDWHARLDSFKIDLEKDNARFTGLSRK
jgi:hypothetical protein